MFQKYLDNLKIAELNKMQLSTIEAAKESEDLVLLSPTGSGKTLAFLLPIIERLDKNIKGVQALIIVPSRELGIQIEQVFRQMGTGYKVNCVYGGHNTKIERNNLTEPPAVLIGTPGRLCYHLEHQFFNPVTIMTLVLDEFDKSLEFGFKDEMTFIVGKIKRNAKKILTSATDLEDIPPFTQVKNPIQLDFLEHASPVTNDLSLKFIKSRDDDKLEILFSLLCKLKNAPCLVFCNQRDSIARVSDMLTRKKMAHGIFHGQMEQDEREKALIKFRNGSFPTLVTTDLAARGLDIPDIEAVIHYQLPQTLDVFTHRNGRTARMNADGTAYLLMTSTEYLPPFIKEKPEQMELPDKSSLPEMPKFVTLYIGGGKKDKINKGDIAGMLMQKGKLEKFEVGLIEVLDHSSYAAVSRVKINKVLELIKGEKVKNKKVKMEISN